MSEPKTAEWKTVKDRAIGIVYASCFLNTAPVNDMIAFMSAMVNDCGSIYKPYDIQTPLLHAIMTGTSSRYPLFVRSQEEYTIAVITHKIITADLKWPSPDFKNYLIEMIFENLDEKTKDDLTLYVKSLTDPAEKLPELPPSDLVSCLYGLIKFILMKEDIPRAISLTVDEVVSSPHVNKPLTTALIAATIGYTEMFVAAQPFFQQREKIDLCLKLYLKYLLGESKRVCLGTLTFQIDASQITTVRRYMHPSSMPSPGGPFHENALSADMNQLAKLKRVSYIETSKGARFPDALSFAMKLYNGVVAAPAKIIAADKQMILAGAAAKLPGSEALIDGFFS